MKTHGAPKTLAQARRYSYGKWGGNPAGRIYREGYCIAEVMPNERGPLPRQCGGRLRKGTPWCAIHTPGAAEARAAKRPPTRYERAISRMERAKEEARRYRRYERALKQIAAASGDACIVCVGIAKKALR